MKSPPFGGQRGLIILGGLPHGAEQEIPEGPVKITVLGEIENAIRLAIKPQCGGLGQA